MTFSFIPDEITGQKWLRALANSHHLLDNRVFERQLELISFASIVVDRMFDAVAEFFRHL